MIEIQQNLYNLMFLSFQIFIFKKNISNFLIEIIIIIVIINYQRKDGHAPVFSAFFITVVFENYERCFLLNFNFD